MREEVRPKVIKRASQKAEAQSGEGVKVNALAEVESLLRIVNGVNVRLARLKVALESEN